MYMIFVNILVKLRSIMIAPNCTGQSGKEKDKLRVSNSQLRVLIKWPESFCVCLERDPYLLLPAGMKLLKTKPRISSCEWLNYNASWISSLKGCLLLKWWHWLGRNGILKVGMGTCQKTDRARDSESLNSDESYPAEAAFPLPSEGINAALPEEMVIVSHEAIALKTMLILLRTHLHTPLCF